MTVTVSSFRTAFAEFTDSTVYPDATVQLWINEAANLLDQSSFGASIDLATMLYVAHNVTLSARDNKVVNVGGIPGGVTGPTSSKSVDKVSANYDTAAVTYKDQGVYNSTSYGQRLWQMMRAFCTPLYVPSGRQGFPLINGF